ncbi:MAG: recombinase RmuC [Lysobacterales bacterium 69-70]|nr:DNA recombination protein RmuC [Xanthomonadaceae bacterium]ODU35564.1 MAG: recombinase RmuC [Xanthomonadaceae bacterium SCN 69-320]ODV22978.1 MAG: recombinase RmuC [Xanthomonadaceae bacterium SCN 69-25]OJY96709.1 MAG: recombinase RmuC [Xanthomonadales bacterium 69-70]
MSLLEILVLAAVVVLLVLLVLQILQLRRSREDTLAPLQQALAGLREDGERLERGLRDDQRTGRLEQSQRLEQLRDAVQTQFAQLAQQQHRRIEDFGLRIEQSSQRNDQRLEALRQALQEDARRAREENAQSLSRFGDQLRQGLQEQAEHSQLRLAEVRGTLETRLKELQADNAKQLDAMRVTVDEKLHATLETRLGESFKLVSERLEQVHRGLGEMQGLAQGVGDLKRVLGNVKTRGMLGEVQLAALLEQLLTVDQYASNIATVPGSSERVEFAVRLPGGGPDTPVWLPIDAKFPREDYERLLDAQERADAEAAAAAAQALERRVREAARNIRDKYISVPATTEFAIMFLPTEGLYAEVLRRPGLFEALQRDQRVVVTGPTTLSATLSSLQMGFRTLAIEQRSSEVWQLLGAVKTEFGKFGAVLEKTRNQLDSVRNSIDAAGVRTRAIERKLRGVESLSSEQSRGLLGEDGLDADE